MHTQNETKTFNVPALLAELSAAEQEFNLAVAAVEKAATFLGSWKGRLNEHQFVQKLEAASADPARAATVIEEQHRLRCSYMSGRLALFCSTSQLSTGLHSRDKLVRTIMKMVATIAHLKGHERDLLTARAFETAQRSNIAFGEIIAKRDREQHKDLTEGRGVDSVKHLYAKLCDKGTSGMEQDARQMTIVEMALIPFAWADLREFYRAPGRKANDELVEAANAAVELLSSEEYRQAWNGYHSSKSRLNEPQYATRLQQALTCTPPNTAAVDVIKNQQRYARIDFITLRANVTELYRRLGELVTAIEEKVEALKQHIADDTMGGDNQKLVAMNNVIAASAVATKIKRMAERWNGELEETETSRQTAEGSLVEAFRQLISAHPYHGLSWSCSGPDSYVEPL